MNVTSIDCDRASVEETRLSTDYLDAQSFEPFDRVMCGNGVYGCTYVFVDALEIDGWSRMDTEGIGLSDRLRSSRSSKQSFGRYAAGIQAFAAHFISLDKNDLLPEKRRARRD